MEIVLAEEDRMILTQLEAKFGKFHYFNVYEESDEYIENSFYSRDDKIISLSIKNTKINEFPGKILNLNQLKVLFLHIPLREIPKEIFSINSLKSLYFDSVEAEFLP